MRAGRAYRVYDEHAFLAAEHEFVTDECSTADIPSAQADTAPRTDVRTRLAPAVLAALAGAAVIALVLGAQSVRPAKVPMRPERLLARTRARSTTRPVIASKKGVRPELTAAAGLPRRRFSVRARSRRDQRRAAVRVMRRQRRRATAANIGPGSPANVVPAPGTRGQAGGAISAAAPGSEFGFER